jgi:hypothetical protein
MFTAAGFTATILTCGALCGQNVVYQQATALGMAGSGMTGIATSGAVISGFGVPLPEALGGRTVAGSPFSATEQRHSLQVLGDGTRIERTDTSQFSRDSEGRTRTELTPAGGDAPATVTIQDPVAGANYFLDPVHKTANKMPLPSTLAVTRAVNGTAVPTVLSGRLMGVVGGGPAQMVTSAAVAGLPSAASGPAAPPVGEDLGTESINGVLAKGTRTTISIPAGQIGNDREIQVVSERWYSDDLQMVVKSSNADPRFGTSSYELTNISRAEPDPSLFQVPPGYTVNEGKAFFTTSQTK